MRILPLPDPIRVTETPVPEEGANDGGADLEQRRNRWEAAAESDDYNSGERGKRDESAGSGWDEGCHEGDRNEVGMWLLGVGREGDRSGSARRGLVHDSGDNLSGHGDVSSAERRAAHCRVGHLGLLSASLDQSAEMQLPDTPVQHAQIDGKPEGDSQAHERHLQEDAKQSKTEASSSMPHSRTRAGNLRRLNASLDKSQEMQLPDTPVQTRGGSLEDDMGVAKKRAGVYAQ